MFRVLKPFLVRLIESRGYCLSYGEPATLDGILSGFNCRRSDFFFVQIGAYDGKESDPLHGHIIDWGWKGIVVEPQPDAFARLKETYSGSPGIMFENAAISIQNERQILFKLRDEFSNLFHGDHRMLTSFSASHILKHLTEDVEADVVLEKIEVPCLSLEGLLAKYNSPRVDFLQIDTEGYDYEIIKSIDFESVRPTIIRCEHAHLSAEEKGECVELLISKGYKSVLGAYDLTAFQSRWLYD